MTADLSRLSLNQITVRRWSVAEAVAASHARGLRWIGLWRDKVAELGLDATVDLLRQHDMQVSSLCRGGFFVAGDDTTRRDRLNDNRAAVDEAAALGSNVVVLVCGGLEGQSLPDARRMVRDGLASLAPYAAERGVQLAVEPLHPMFAADRSVIVTLAQALDLAEEFPPDQVGVVIDTYHLWWDPDVESLIARAGERILSFQICDWLDPLPDPLLGRGMMGDGVIDFQFFRDAVGRAGYVGPIEVEIFNQEVWNTPGDVTLDLLLERYSAHVG